MCRTTDRAIRARVVPRWRCTPTCEDNVQVMTEPAQAAQSQQAQAALAQLSDQFFEVAHTADPFGATQVGAPGFDALVPDPSRAGAARDAAQIARIEERLGRIDPGLLDQA